MNIWNLHGMQIQTKIVTDNVFYYLTGEMCFLGRCYCVGAIVSTHLS